MTYIYKSPVFRIGKKNIFQIKSQIIYTENDLFEKSHFQINKLVIGYFHNQDLMSMAHSELAYLKDKFDSGNFVDNDVFEKEITWIGNSQKRFVKSLNKENKKIIYFGNFGVAYDDFLIGYSILKDEIAFVWKLFDKPYFSYIGYDDSIHHSRISKAYFKNCVEEYGKIIEYYRKIVPPKE